MRILFLSWSSGLHKEAGGARRNPGRQGRGRTDGRTSVLLDTERLGRVGGPLPGLALPLPMNALIRTVLATRAKQHDRQVTSVPSQGRTCSTTTPMLTSLLRKDTDLLQRRSETRGGQATSSNRRTGHAFPGRRQLSPRGITRPRRRGPPSLKDAPGNRDEC